MRVATLNVFGLSGNWSDRLAVLRDGFLALDADLVTLQETMVREEVDQAAEILGPGFQLAHASHREANGSGITTATRWPLGRVVEVDLHVTERTHEFHLYVSGDRDLGSAPVRPDLAGELPARLST